MKKFGIAALVATIALIAPAASIAGGKKYQGGFDPEGSLSFIVKKSEHGKKVVHFKFNGVPADCGTPQHTSGNITFGIKVRHNKFHTVAVAGDPQNPSASLTLDGRINGGSAKGTMEIHGSNVAIDGGSSGNCTTGDVNWTAFTAA